MWIHLASLLGWQSLLQQLHIELILLGHLALLPLPHSIANVAFKAKTERNHRIANAKNKKKKEGQELSKDDTVTCQYLPVRRERSA